MENCSILLNQVEKVTSFFDIGKIEIIKPNKVGLIHKTFEVSTQRGLYIIQRINPIFGEIELFNMVIASEYLVSNGLPAPKVIYSLKGEPFLKFEHYYWRITEKLPGFIIKEITSESEACAVGEMLGRFHKVMSSFPKQLKKGGRTLHNSREVLEKAKKIATLYRNDKKFEAVSDIIPNLFNELESLLLPDNLPQRIIHGDPKITNFLFLDKDKVSGILDLDMVNYHTILVDLGDALRSWCGKKEEESENFFRIDIAKSAINSWKKAGLPLSKIEEGMILKSVKLITLELAARFLNDYFEECYFAWNKDIYPDAASHNLARAKSMINLASTIPTEEDL